MFNGIKINVWLQVSTSLGSCFISTPPWTSLQILRTVFFLFLSIFRRLLRNFLNYLVNIFNNVSRAFQECFSKSDIQILTILIVSACQTLTLLPDDFSLRYLFMLTLSSQLSHYFNDYCYCNCWVETSEKKRLRNRFFYKDSSVTFDDFGIRLKTAFYELFITTI